MTQAPAKQLKPGQPWWPAVVAVLAMCGLYLSLPESLTFGPSWLLLAVVFVLMVPAVIAKMRGSFALNQVLGYIVLGIVTAAMLWSLFMLIRSLILHQDHPRRTVALRCRSLGHQLPGLRVVVLASRRGRTPCAPSSRQPHRRGFSFSANDPVAQDGEAVEENWSPGFVDYLFLAFNTSTAFSPTDSPVLSRWAKVAMMVQSTISFATVALLAARAVNIL